MAGARCAARDALPRECPPPLEKPPPRRASTEAVLNRVTAIRAAKPVETREAVLMGIIPAAGAYGHVRTHSCLGAESLKLAMLERNRRKSADGRHASP